MPGTIMRIHERFVIVGAIRDKRDIYDDDTIDADDLVIRKGRGYLNAGLRWSATNSLMLEVNVNDITKNNESDDSMNREVKIIYFENF